jgi:hypothetical protein
MNENIIVTIDSKYHREQFDDWLAGGKVNYKGKTYYWFAQNNNYGYGWEIEPVNEEDWDDIPEEKYDEIFTLIQESLLKHKIDYTF